MAALRMCVCMRVRAIAVKKPHKLYFRWRAAVCAGRRQAKLNID